MCAFYYVAKKKLIFFKRKKVQKLPLPQGYFVNLKWNITGLEINVQKSGNSISVKIKLFLEKRLLVTDPVQFFPILIRIPHPQIW